MSQLIRLGTRGSQLALRQSNMVADQLRNLGNQVELITIKTEGDQSQASLAQIGGQGVFTKRLQTALLDGEIDLAVHSLKDLPTVPADGLKIAAVPEREDVRDALVLNAKTTANSFSELPSGARIGTGSTRRKAQLLYLRKDVEVCDIRGNVDTRLGKLDSGEFDAVVLAAAGLNRLGLEHRISFLFSREAMLPAVGQGALGLETRSDDDATISALSKLNASRSHAEVLAERSMLRELGAGCMAPVGVATHWSDGKSDGNLSLSGVILSVDGSERIMASETGAPDLAVSIGAKVASSLFADGGERLLKASMR